MFKVAFIGAGSMGFTRKLVADILTVPELRDMEISFMDINAENLRMATELCRRDIESNGLKVKITPTLNRRKALENADYVVNTVRIGGLGGLKADVEIPLKYGVDQCVGDTLCAGGIMYGQRGIAAVLDFCKDIREVSATGAMMLNYSNPNAMITWAANKYGKVKTVGLCHGVQHSHTQITKVIELLVNMDRKKKKGDTGYVTVSKKEVDVICAGINHQTWFVSIIYDGKDWTGRMLEGFEAHDEYRRKEMVRIDMLRRFGYFSTESNGHLSEYVAWYRKRPSELRKWIDKSDCLGGGSAAYLKHCLGERGNFEDYYRKSLAQAPKEFKAENRSVEHGSSIIESLETGRIYRGHFNVVNNGCITNLPSDAIVELPGYADRNGINIPVFGDLPLGCAAVCNASISVQRMAVEAAVHGDDMLLRQAMMMDPLVGAVCTTSEIWCMTDEMLVAMEKWLPQYKKAISEAKKRIASRRKSK